MKKLFILHGWSYDTDKWSDLLIALKKYDFESSVITIPGLTEKLENVWDINDYAEWLDKKLKAEKDITLIGHSNGGRIALYFILKYPNKVKKLFLIDSAGIHNNDLRIRIKRILFKLITTIGKKFTNSNSLKNLLYKFARENDYNKASGVMKKTMQNLINYDLTNKLHKIEVDTNIIWGEMDKITPLSDGILMNKSIKNSKLHIINNAKHSPQFTDPEKVSNIIYENI
ncbi:MAG: alpha/beta hydrolase [Candidatus Woesebacteria bacterium]|nr:alpha/beta hydrolase [Candidatus Woesebacteria bacterium]